MDYQLYYWRTKKGVETDFIVYGSKGFFAFEIKRSSHVHMQDAKGLLSFQQDYPQAKLYLIYGGDRKYFLDNVEVWPMQEILFALPEILSSK